MSQGYKNSWVKKSSVIEQLLEIINEVSLDKLGMKEHIEREIEKYYKFKYGVLGITAEQEQEQKKIDVKNYAKYILKEGAVYEKRELLSCLKSKIVLKDKLISLE